MELDTAIPASAPRSWWGRNWKWVVPVGCLVPVLICGGVIAVIYFGVTAALKSSGAYIEAVAIVEADPRAQAALGTPIEAGTPTSGSIETTGSAGSANFPIRVSGPNGSGTLHVDAVMAADQWSFNTLTLVMDETGERIDLLAPN